MYYNTKPKSVPKGVIVLCFHLKEQCQKYGIQHQHKKMSSVLLPIKIIVFTIDVVLVVNMVFWE